MRAALHSGTGAKALLPIHFSSRVCAMMRLAVLILLAAAPGARADGGAVIAQETTDGITVTVFASPAPLRAGPADISVMLQDAATAQPLLDRDVLVSVSPLDESAGSAWVPPCCSMEKSSSEVPATRANAQNKLLHSANVIVPSSGPVAITVRVAGAAPIVTKMDARPPLPPAATYWPFLAIPPVAVGLFAINRRARHPRRK